MKAAAKLRVCTEVTLANPRAARDVRTQHDQGIHAVNLFHMTYLCFKMPVKPGRLFAQALMPTLPSVELIELALLSKAVLAQHRLSR
jgi:hypothetical protein